MPFKTKKNSQEYRAVFPFRGHIYLSMETRQLNFFSLLLPILLSSCISPIESNHQKKALNTTITFELLEEHRIHLPIDFNVGLNLTAQPYTRNDTDFILMGDIEGSRLVEIDISHKKFSKALFLPKVAQDRYPVFVNHYLNKDTILILRGISNEYSLRADSVLYSINWHGQQNGPYTLVNSPFRLTGMNRDIPQASFYHHFMPMELSDNRFFVNPLPLFGTHKKCSKDAIGVHELGYFDFKNSDAIRYKGIAYYRQQDSSKAFADEQMKTYIHAIDSSKILVSHANQAELLLLSVASGEYLNSNESGSLLPKPKPLDSTTTTPAKNPQSTVFNKVLYDPSKKFAYRFASFGTELSLKPGDLQTFRDSNVWVGAYDSALNLIGQAIQPRWFATNPKPIYFKGKFICVSPTAKLGEFKLQFVGIDTSGISQTDFNKLRNRMTNLKPTITSTSINSLYKSYQLPKNSIVLSISNRACPYCINHSTQYFMMNLPKMEKEGVYLVISDRSASPELKALKSSHIIIDTKNELEDLLKQNIDNPALMLWNGDKVSHTMILPPKEVPLIDLYLQTFQEQILKP